MPHLSESFGDIRGLGLSTNEEAQSLSREDGCKLTRPLFLLLTICLFSLPALAVSSIELHKLTASDAAAGDEFGFSVALSGTTALVGAHVDDHAAGSDSGSAYLFDVATGSQLFKLTASDADAGDFFGDSVAISGNTAIVGASGNDDDGGSSGSAYLYDFSDPCNPVQIAKLTASDAAAADWFGNSVAISGSTAIVGAYRNDDAGSNSGSAYLFDAATGSQLFKLTASDAAAGDDFGVSVALSGATAIVGAWLDDDAGTWSGSAYLFDFSDPCNIIETKLTASDAAERDRFGFSVALSGTTALVGAYQDDDAGSESGSAYLFDVSDPCNPIEIAKLTASDAAVNDWFGYSVALSGATALVGAYLDDDAGFNSGSAYLFDVSDPCNPIEIGRLTASDTVGGDRFGSSVAISGTIALVGALANDDAGVNSGSAYLFRFCPSSDFDDDCDVDFVDLGMMAEDWLLEELSADVAPNGGDGIVNFLDWAIFADGWQTTIDFDDLAEFADQWLKTGSNDLIADIAPTRDGDGIVNLLDFAALANNWLAGV